MLSPFVVGSEELVLGLSVEAFGPFSLVCMVHEVSRTEELAKRRRAQSVDRAGLEVGEHRAWYVLVA